MITNPIPEATMTPTAAPALDADIVRRPELHQLVESLNRELSGYTQAQAAMNAKLDQILSSKTEEAREMGKLQEKVSTMSATLEKQGTAITALETGANRREVKNRDQLVKFLVDAVKFLGAALLGYLMSRSGMPH